MARTRLLLFALVWLSCVWFGSWALNPNNATRMFAGLALFMLGSGPIRGFALVLCIGIMTSMFSGVMVSRAMVNLLYGQRRLSRLAI